MRLNIFRVLGSLLVVALVSPVGYLCAMNSHPLPYLTSPSANWADSENATNMFNRIQLLARKVQNEDGPLTVDDVQLAWQIDAGKLDQIRSQVNEMSGDLLQLCEMRKKLEPWQQQLLGRMTPKIHELVYETQAAIEMLNHQHSMMALYPTSYPHYLAAISHDANQLAGSVGTYTQYVHAAKKLAKLQKRNGAKVS